MAETAGAADEPIGVLTGPTDTVTVPAGKVTKANITHIPRDRTSLFCAINIPTKPPILKLSFQQILNEMYYSAVGIRHKTINT